ncbi:TPA: hypothetical protein ACHWCP_RS08935 [Escherichia coli]
MNIIILATISTTQENK